MLEKLKKNFDLVFKDGIWIVKLKRDFSFVSTFNALAFGAGLTYLCVAILLTKMGLYNFAFSENNIYAGWVVGFLFLPIGLLIFFAGVSSFFSDYLHISKTSIKLYHSLFNFKWTHIGVSKTNLKSLDIIENENSKYELSLVLNSNKSKKITHEFKKEPLENLVEFISKYLELK
ncbi:MAG: hypothetical protein KC493_11035 [Bacteriovoracaceae bacterium]|nr:hypothetical protein [Bacteriovoracaceae bacterium]